MIFPPFTCPVLKCHVSYTSKPYVLTPWHASHPQYNYLVDPRTRMGMKKVAWRGAILIFDEAHNVEVLSSSCSQPDAFSGS